MTTEQTVLQVEGITKRFPGILANDNVNLELHRGEILALLGENGAGKSTLMNIIYGLYHADEGTIRIKGKVLHFASPREAIHSGIGMVHQHFQLIPVMTVAENVTLGEEATVSTMPAKDIFGASRLESAGKVVRTIWGFIWRAFLPLYAAAIGLFFGQLMLRLVFAIGTRFVSADLADSFSFARLSVETQATVALGQIYANLPSVVTFAVYLPLVVGTLTGVLTVVFGYRYMRRTWAKLNALPDSIVISAIDLLSTGSTIQNRRRAAARVTELSRQYGLEVDPNAVIEELPIGMQQRVEIIKALYRHADILILDEPTAVLTPQESEELFKIMRSLAAQGVSIIFISHKLKEVLSIADNIVVMRGGKVVGTAKPSESDQMSLAAMMVGREVSLKVAKNEAKPGAVVLRVENLIAKDERGSLVIDDLNFEVHAGEVLGIAGVQGNGQTELVEVLTGLRSPSGGRFDISGEVFTHANPREITMANAAHVPEDRQRYGMVMPFPVSENLVLNQYYDKPFASTPTLSQLPVVGGVYAVIFLAVLAAIGFLWSHYLYPALSYALQLAELDPRENDGSFILALVLTLVMLLITGVVAHLAANFVATQVRAFLSKQGNPKEQGGLVVNENAVDSHAEQLVKEFDIRTPSIKVNAGNLSGGNQQKMVIAREFSRKPHLLIASQPTRGIDVGAIEFIHQRIIKQRDEGAAVLLVSAELDEIMSLSDRIAVMYRGKIIDTVPGKMATREQLGLLMAGVKAEPVPSVREESINPAL